MSGAVDYSEMRFVDLKRKVVFELVREREREALKAFYKRMNETSVRLGCSKKTNFAVAHGMHHDRNYSTALDIATLSCNAIRNHPLLADIINTKYYECRSRLFPDHCYKWKNTNEMIWDSSKCYYGVKTGVTQTAGPCLSVHYKSSCGTFDFIIVVLNSKTKEARFLEIPKLVEWAIQKIQRVKKINYKPSLKRQLLRNLAHF
jgi:D-alanyl-D-alanine carboxypeptidase